MEIKGRDNIIGVSIPRPTFYWARHARMAENPIHADERTYLRTMCCLSNQKPRNGRGRPLGLAFPEMCRLHASLKFWRFLGGYAAVYFSLTS